MNTEDFEHKLRSHDPAANLAGRDSAEQRAIFEKAISGQPSNVISISRWSKRRKAVSAAAAALLIIGVGGPVISGSVSASPERLVFGESVNKLSNSAADSALRDGNSKMYPPGYQWFWGTYHYELPSDFASELPSSAPAYKIVNIENLDKRISDIAAELGVKNLETLEDGTVTNSDVMTLSENFYSWTQEGFASFSYYNSAVDPWRNCYKNDDVVGAVCNPITDNMPTEVQAKSAAKDLITRLGFEIANMKFQTYTNDASVDVSANEQIAGQDSPINFYISYVSNLEIYTIGGSLTKLVDAGSYDLVTIEKAINRANELTDRTIKQWTDSKTNVEPGEVSGGKSSDDGVTTEPSEPSVDPSGPQLEYKPTTVSLTKTEIEYQMFTMSDGSVFWLPMISFWGIAPDIGAETYYGSIIAIVDSQIDLESLYSNWAMKPMYRGAAID